nr:hypothetical protein BaRGS_008729 [Batillaria attramentaria]
MHMGAGISALQTATALTAGRGEEQRLRTENEALRKEIEKARLSLMVAEIRNGVRQVPLPARRTLATSASAGGEGQAPAASPPTEQAQSKPAAAQPQAKKAKKETGPPKEEKKAAKEGKEESKGKGKKAAEAGSEEPEKMDVSRLDFRIGKIVAVEKHPDADTLYVETVDLGEKKTRTIVSGLVPHIPIEQMRDRLAVFMCNLKPSKMRGIASEGMIMCANAGKVEILVPPPGVVPGDRISFDGYSGTPDKQLNPKKKIWETLKTDIRTNSERVATYKGVPFKVEGKGIVKAPTLADAQIS